MKSMKKLLSSLLIAVLCMALVAVPASAEGTGATLAPTASSYQFALAVADNGAAGTYGTLPADIELVANQDIAFSLMNWTVAAKTATGEWGVAMDPSVTKDVPYKIFANTCGGANYSELNGYCCGLSFDPAYLEANPNLAVTLNLCVYDGENKTVLASQTFSAMNQFVASAKVGEETKYFMSLASAIAAGGEVTLLKDVTVGTTINVTIPTTLDLNGKTITSTVSGARLFEVSADFTINGNSGTITGNGAGYGAVRTAAGVKVNIIGGTYNYNTDNGAVFKGNATGSIFNISGATVSTNYWIFDSGAYMNGMTVTGGSYVSSGAGFVVPLAAGANFTMSGAYVDVQKGSAVEVGSLGGTATLTNNTITTHTMVDGGGGMGGMCVAVTANTTVVINGGTYTGPGSAVCATTTASPDITVNGGTFTGGIEPHTGKLTINGGTFNSYNKKVATGTVVITGGTFDAEPAAGDIADGYAAVKVGEVYNVHQHNPELVTATASNCTETGLYEHFKCAVCGLCYESVNGTVGALKPVDTFIKPVSHDLAYCAPYASTCSFQGYVEHFNCTRCGKAFEDQDGTVEITEVRLPFAPHTPTKHDAVPSTCINYGTIEYYECTECHLYFSDAACTVKVTSIMAPSLGGHVTKKVPPVTASCTNTGNILHYFCTECGLLFLDAAGTQQTDYESVQTIVDHTVSLVEAVAPTFEKEGNIAYEKCEICGQFFDVEYGNLLSEEDVILPKLQYATGITLYETKVEIFPNFSMAIPVLAIPDGAVIGECSATVADATVADVRCITENDMLLVQIGGIKPGTTQVTVTTKSGLTATCDVVVKAPIVLNVGSAETVTLNSQNYNLQFFSFTPKADGAYTLFFNKAEEEMMLYVVNYTEMKLEEGTDLTAAGQFGYQYNLKAGIQYEIQMVNPAEQAATTTLNVGMVSHTHHMTKTEAKAATYTTDGNLEYYTCDACAKLFADAEGKTETTLEKVTLAQLIEVVGTKAEVSEGAMNVAIEKAGTTGNVTLDLTKDDVVGKETAPVSSAVLPVASLEKVATAGASLTVAKADATVIMDAKALETIAKAAGTGTVTLVVEQVKTEDLAVVQQNAVKDQKVAAVISAELINTATNTNIGAEAAGGFGGGTVTVHIPFTPETGYKGTDYKVLYVADNGALTEIKTEYKDGCLVVALNHFSEYVIVNANYVKPSTGTNPATGDYGMVMPLAIMLFCGVAMAGLIIGKKKYNF